MEKKKWSLKECLSDNFTHELFNRVLVCIITHTAFCIAFFGLGVWEMGLFNICSIILFVSLGAYVCLSKAPKVTVVDGFSSVEYIIHTVFAVWFTGYALGFQFVLFALAVPVVVTTRDKGEIRFSFYRLFGSAVLFVGLYELCVRGVFVPKYTFSPVVSAVSTFALFLLMFLVFDLEIVSAFQNFQNHLETSRQTERENMQKMNDMLRKMNSNIAGVIEERDLATGEHTERTTRYVKQICEELVREGKFTDILDEKMVKSIVDSASLHDIGKIKTPDAILNKPGKLTPEEFEIIKHHTTDGGKIIRNMFRGIDDDYYEEVVYNIAMYHHEKWDGTGYPQGLKGEEIPLCARIMAVADVYDALVSARVYKAPMPKEKAYAILREDSGKHFDPDVVEAFLKTRSIPS